MSITDTLRNAAGTSEPPLDYSGHNRRRAAEVINRDRETVLAESGLTRRDEQHIATVGDKFAEEFKDVLKTNIPRPPAPIDPLIQGLLTHLPAPGEEWPEERRQQWLELMKGSFCLVYRSDKK